MAAKQQSKVEEVLQQVSAALNMSEPEFANIYEMIGSGERAEELNLAHQGQLHDIMSPNAEK